MSKQDRQDRSVSRHLNTAVSTSDKSKKERREALRRLAKSQADQKAKGDDKPKEGDQ